METEMLSEGSSSMSHEVAVLYSEEGRAAKITFMTAFRAKDAEKMRGAFDDLYQVYGRLGSAFDVIVRMYGEKKGDDTAPLERVATAAIRLAEKVIESNGAGRGAPTEQAQ